MVYFMNEIFCSFCFPPWIATRNKKTFYQATLDMKFSHIFFQNLAKKKEAATIDEAIQAAAEKSENSKLLSTSPSVLRKIDGFTS